MYWYTGAYLPFLSVCFFPAYQLSLLSSLLLTPCHRATRKLVIALPCIVDGSRVSSFSYVPSCTWVCQLFLLTYRFKVINNLMQDVGSQVIHKPTGPDPLFWEPKDCKKVTSHSDTLSVFCQLWSWLCVGMFCNRTTFCVSYMRIHVLMSLFIVMKYGQWQWHPHN